MDWLRRRGKTGKPGTDLFGQPMSEADARRSDAEMIADRLREMSEIACRAGLETASGLIELSALVAEMEGRSQPLSGILPSAPDKAGEA